MSAKLLPDRQRTLQKSEWRQPKKLIKRFMSVSVADFYLSLLKLPYRVGKENYTCRVIEEVMVGLVQSKVWRWKGRYEELFNIYT